MTKTTKYMSKISRNVIFSKSTNPTPRNTPDGEGGGIGVLLIALTRSKYSYSTPLLKGVTQDSRGMSFNKLLYIRIFVPEGNGCQDYDCFCPVAIARAGSQHSARA